jgi:acyl carrier protein
MNFIDLFNQVARAARPAHNSYAPLDSLDTKLVETDIDSLDGMMIVMYFAIIYDISDDLAKDFHPETPQELLDFLQTHKKREPASVEEALEMIK